MDNKFICIPFLQNLSVQKYLCLSHHNQNIDGRNSTPAPTAPSAHWLCSRHEQVNKCLQTPFCDLPIDIALHFAAIVSLLSLCLMSHHNNLCLRMSSYDFVSISHVLSRCICSSSLHLPSHNEGSCFVLGFRFKPNPQTLNTQLPTPNTSLAEIPTWTKNFKVDFILVDIANC